MTDKTFTRREMGVLVAAGTAVAAVPAEAAQVHMERALDLAQAALTELRAAKANKGGHRKEAIDHLRYVIQEIKRGIAYAS